MPTVPTTVCGLFHHIVGQDLLNTVTNCNCFKVWLIIPEYFHALFDGKIVISRRDADDIKFCIIKPFHGD